MNYASGLMMGMSLAQAAKNFLGGSVGKGMRGKANPMGEMFDLTGEKRGNKNPSAAFDLPSINFLQDEKKDFELVSALPGRRRYRASSISKELAAALKAQLSKLDYITTVEVNPDTGSILFTFDEKNLSQIDELAHALKKRLFSDSYAEYKLDRKVNKVFYGSITKSIKSTIRHISHTILRETNGLFDIRSLSSIIFAILGFRKVVMNGEFPSGIQMLWWAVSLMRGIKTA